MARYEFPVPPDTELAAYAGGRIFSERRRAGVGECGPDGRMRLDAMAGQIQEVAAGDALDAGVKANVAWVVRRTTMLIGRRPRYGEEIELTTWCSGTGAAWAERRTTVHVGGEPIVEAVALWVCLDRAEPKPLLISGTFFDPWRSAAGDRKVRSKLLLPAIPSRPLPSSPWPLRHSDIDLLGHVNNAVAWSAAEQVLHRTLPGTEVAWGQIEYREPIEIDDEITVVTEPGEGWLDLWLLEGDATAVAARLGLAGR